MNAAPTPHGPSAADGGVVVTVGRIGRPHGVRGEVTVAPSTDDVAGRFAPGAVLSRAGGGTITVLDAREHSGRLLVQFDGVNDRDSAEALRGTELQVRVRAEDRPDDPDEYFDHQLVGLAARLGDGREVGRVVALIHLPAQDLLEILRPDGSRPLVPFVRALVPEVDLDGGFVVLDPPPGLLDPEQADEVPAEGT